MFSLMTVMKQTGNIVCGQWIQHHIGTLESATIQARKTETTNGNKIIVAVVDEISGGNGYWENRVRLD